MASTTFTLTRDNFGKLVMTAEDGQVYHGVAPVRAFPIQSPNEGISLVQGDGKEVAWIDHVDTLPEPARTLVKEELEGVNSCPRFRAWSASAATPRRAPGTWKRTAVRPSSC